MVKKFLILLILFIIPIITFSNGNKEIKNTSEEKVTSNEQPAAPDPKDEEIKNLKFNNEKLTKDNLDLQVTLVKANKSIDGNTQLLIKLNDRLASDQKEIDDLRSQIKELIKTGVEVVSYDFNVETLYGYPNTFELLLSYNFPFLPVLGVSTGFSYLFEDKKAIFYIGAKLNIKIR
jgi:hypothetical protein